MAEQPGGRLKLFAGTANRWLGEEIARYLGIPLGRVTITRFADGEIYVRFEENARGEDVFVVQPTSPPVNEHLMELLIMLDALRRASAGRITAVVPYYGYARKDKKDAPREPITGRLVADLLVTAGADRVLTVDLHAGQIEGFFNVPVDHLRAMPLFADYLREKGLRQAVVVAADEGAVKRSKQLADRLDLPLAIIFQRRVGKDVKEPVQIVGEVEGRTPIMIEDIIDTAGTLANAVDVLVRSGARREVYVCATHAILAGPALERLSREEIREVILTNTVAIPGDRRLPKFTILSAAPLLAEAIRRIHEHQSVSILFT
ncbi:MAG: ribose-phosphate pyrophosphokinase [Armatimonadota bacterium]|nr:ribose-phosphate pyrophosphokinase [Armatimonadota bacterium]MDR7447884.1 ribose-phosphate pyrophosphokinase [Armatimonadota bacterium]MDR7459909.1 ribose-phosphate pyrophosphokinase [Armatimonadota bacterium]MDR7479768.1 ribose-phosphate pyrophosphokinase [Armatimonadota bacterium]MDR7487569.1 ribose-phosphate pyrophosphokinase [Armatimonadota bacterium]